MLETLGSLIGIASITGTKEEKEIHDFLLNLLREESSNNKSGVAIDISDNSGISETGEFYGSVVVTLDVDSTFDSIALMGHYDVVPVSKNWSSDPFSMIEKDGRLFGRGSCDMKAGLAIMIDVFRKSLVTKPNKNIKLVFTSDEETGEPNGLTDVIRQDTLKKVDFAIALEPTNGEINTGVFGYLDAEFQFRGKPCHSSKPELGENAIYKTGPFIQHIASQPTELVGSIDYNRKVLAEALSITKISGGSASNIIPDSTSVQTNYRYSPKRSGDDVERIFGEVATNVDAEMKILEHNPASRVLDIDNPLLTGFLEKIGKSVSDLVLVPFWSDMSQTSRRGIPSINYGPGSIEQAHQDDEFIERDALEKTHRDFIKYLFN